MLFGSVFLGRRFLSACLLAFFGGAHWVEDLFRPKLHMRQHGKAAARGSWWHWRRWERGRKFNKRISLSESAGVSQGPPLPTLPGDGETSPPSGKGSLVKELRSVRIWKWYSRTGGDGSLSVTFSCRPLAAQSEGELLPLPSPGTSSLKFRVSVTPCWRVL